ncbi:ras-related protein rab-5c [Anaeramoeba flamelloides]|uniref:Ras-related protein rab-5c n=1 Tax=Anaeramoeba flamelloides TaxID=1746091 RepID=A0AAV8A9H2_9EUKA|nr:ras-related protein rab-5c [Anaeramoeba flamelloides]KAJ6226246.1 ras-related protein rab-5c [Anaeramoeba flamelloides]
MTSENKLYSFKIVIIGESSVGKSSLLLRFHKNQFSNKCEPTIGASHVQKTINTFDKQFQLLIWDTAGQEQYHSLAPMYYRGARGALVVYDQTARESFNKAKKWIDELKTQVSQNVRIVLCANKSDLENKNVDIEEVKTYCEENEMLLFQTSAKTGENVHEAFMGLIKLLPNKEGEVEEIEEQPENYVYLNNLTKKNDKKNGCC